MLILWAVLQWTPLVLAQEVSINFTTARGLSVGVMPPGLVSGSVVTGQIRVNLGTLPPPANPGRNFYLRLWEWWDSRL